MIPGFPAQAELAQNLKATLSMANGLMLTFIMRVSRQAYKDVWIQILDVISCVTWASTSLNLSLLI